MAKLPRQYVDLELFYECGSCGMYHRVNFDGDCRDDEARWAAGELDEEFGSDGWHEVPQP